MDSRLLILKCVKEHPRNMDESESVCMKYLSRLRDLLVGDKDGTKEGSDVMVGVVGTEGVGPEGGLSLSSVLSLEDEEEELPPPLVAK